MLDFVALSPFAAIDFGAPSGQLRPTGEWFSTIRPILKSLQQSQHLTVVTKSNAQRYGLVLWDEIASEVARDFPDVTWDKMLVDAMTVRMTLNPKSLDTIVATNLHADILSDLAAALAGSIGIAPTANLNPIGTAPSMFEPIHGSAFDITGKGIANPIATYWSVALMLDHLGEADAAAHLMRAIECVTAQPAFHTPDLGGQATTVTVTNAGWSQQVDATL